MNTIKSVLITGANAGLGRETARQMALRPEVEKVYLACRNPEKALAAKAYLEAETGRSIFEIVIADVADVASVRSAVADLSSPIDAVVLNAGGMGGTTPHALTADGVTTIFASNLLGHVTLVDELLKRDLLTSTVVYAGSEAARGVPRMGIARPVLKSASVEEFTGFARDDFGGDAFAAYGAVKLTAAMWMAAMARRHRDIRFITMSPGGTSGTNGMDDLPLLQKMFFKYVGSTIMPLVGMMHSVETGAKRFVSALTDPRFESGHFYASGSGAPTGRVLDQDGLYPRVLGTVRDQDNAAIAIEQLAAPHVTAAEAAAASQRGEAANANVITQAEREIA